MGAHSGRTCRTNIEDTYGGHTLRTKIERHTSRRTLRTHYRRNTFRTHIARTQIKEKRKCKMHITYIRLYTNIAAIYSKMVVEVS